MVQYVASIATYFKSLMHKEVLLGCTPLLLGDDLSADQNLNYINDKLKAHFDIIFNVVHGIRHSCLIRRRLSYIAGLPIFGCYSHKLNSAIESWIKT